MAADTKERRVVITYTARVAGVDENTYGDELTNSAQPHWSATPVTPPTTIAGYEALPNKLDAVSDTVGIVEPQLSIKKTVDEKPGITAAPGQVFEYQAKVLNG